MPFDRPTPTSEDALRQELDEYERLFEFLTALADELRRPITPLASALRLARLDEHREYALELATRQVGRLSRLVNDVLDVARLAGGTLELRRETLDLRRVVEHAVDALRSTIAVRRQDLRVLLPPDPVTAEVDRARLEQVVASLLDIAAKRTDTGGRIELSLARLDDEVELRVTAARPRREGDLGIELTLVQRLIALHGGSVEEHDAGIRIRLPARPGRAVTGTKAPAATRPLQVLLIDDSADLVEGLRVLLEGSGHRVREARDGQSGLEVARRQPPDVALVDLALPGMDGFELARRMRGEPSLARTVLIALSGWGREEDRTRAREAGFDHHLVKPVDIDAIDELLARVTPAG